MNVASPRGLFVGSWPPQQAAEHTHARTHAHTHAHTHTFAYVAQEKDVCKGSGVLPHVATAWLHSTPSTNALVCGRPHAATGSSDSCVGVAATSEYFTRGVGENDVFLPTVRKAAVGRTLTSTDFPVSFFLKAKRNPHKNLNDQAPNSLTTSFTTWRS